MRATVHDLRSPGYDWGVQDLEGPIKEGSSGLFNHLLRANSDGQLHQIFGVSFPSHIEVTFFRIENLEVRRCDCGDAYLKLEDCGDVYLKLEWRALT